jgi:hypothetical protein
MRKFIIQSLLIILPIILFMISCAPGSCFEETECYVKASFYTGVPPGKLSPPASLTLSGFKNDSLIYNNKSAINPALIPLNASSDSSIFIMNINGVTDTLLFLYVTYPHLISKECGYTYYHQLDTILPLKHFHSITRIEYQDKLITNLNVENIRIFY